MATITENLKKILSAVYGKDVRQAIHDSIKQCKMDVDAAADNATSTANTAVETVGQLTGTVNQMMGTLGQLTGTANQMMGTLGTLETLMDIDMTEEAEKSIFDHEYWAVEIGSEKMMKKYGTEAGTPVQAQAVIATVKPGEIYKVTTLCVDDYYVGSSSGVIVGTGYYDVNDVAGPGEDPRYYSASSDYSPTTANGNEYIITIPESANRLFVNLFYYTDDQKSNLSVRKVKMNEPSGGAKLLWSGLIKNGSVAWVEFTVPEKCFFNSGRELILMLNGYCPNEERDVYEEYTIGLCFGSAADFGLTDSDGGPYKNGEAIRYGYRQESYVKAHGLRVEMSVQKVTDSRYAVCNVRNRSDDFYMTSISAIVPA